MFISSEGRNRCSVHYAANRTTAVDSTLTSACLILVAGVHNAKRIS
jgi:hypothetical protein